MLLALGLAIGLLIAPAAGSAQATDPVGGGQDQENAAPLPVAAPTEWDEPVSFTATNAGSTSSTSNPYRQTFWKWTSTISGELVIDTCAGADFDTVLYAGGQGGGMAESDNSCSTGSRIPLLVSIGETYLIGLGGAPSGELPATGIATITIARTTTSDGLKYKHNGETGAEVLQCTDTCNPALSIPASITVDDQPFGVQDISDVAFLWRTEITSVQLPESLTSIGIRAFSATHLTAVTIPDSVQHIGEAAFAEAASLTDVTLGNSVTSIGKLAFDGTGISSLVVPAALTTGSSEAFKWVDGLQTLFYLGGPVALANNDDNPNAQIYRLPEATGWGSTLEGLPVSSMTAPTGGAISVSGTPQVGETLTANVTDFTGFPTPTAESPVRWERSDSLAGPFMQVSVGATYTPFEADEGKYFRAVFSQSNLAGDASTTSDPVPISGIPTPTPPTPPVTPAPAPTPTPTPTPTPAVVAPSAVRSVKRSYKKAKATVSWAVPASGNATGYKYRVRIQKKGKWAGWSSWKTISKTRAVITRKATLRYRVEIVAQNSGGQSPGVATTLTVYRK